MGVINTILGTPLGYVIYFAYLLTGSYGLAIVIFAVLVKFIIFPVMMMAHRNSIRLLQLQPALTIIKRRYSGDRERLNEEQYTLFTKERYSPVLGVVPLLLQLFLVIGMLQVMYHPLQHLLRLDGDAINALVLTLRGIYGDLSPAREQLMVFDAFRNPDYLPMFRQALAGFADAEVIIEQIVNTNLNFIVFDLGRVPSFTSPSIELIIPAFAGLAALVFCLVQNAISPGALSQSARTNLFLTVFTVGLSLYFALVMPVGVGIYWGVTNFAGIGVVVALYLMYNPRKMASEAFAYIKANRKTPEEIKAEREENKALKTREKSDAAKFIAAKKRLVFYALTSGQYKYYKTIIEYLLEHSDITIHYLTNDSNDAVFQHQNPQLIPYYAGQHKTISLMLKLDADILVTTVPDLQSFHMKRSIVREIEYIHTFHAFTSVHLIYREKAYDYFDTIFCTGSHQVIELRRREELAKLPKKKLLKIGYGVFDQLAESHVPGAENEKPRILIAPSWQAENIMESCIEPILDNLLDKGYEIVVRPHPQYVRLFPERMKELVDNYSEYVGRGEVIFELDFSSNFSIFSSDILITDWSAISYEFAYCTLKPCVFINTPMKIMNPNYKKYGLEPLDISLRDRVGISVDMDDLGTLPEAITGLLADKDGYRDQIKITLLHYLYNPGRSGEAGGKYIISRLS